VWSEPISRSSGNSAKRGTNSLTGVTERTPFQINYIGFLLYATFLAHTIIYEIYFSCALMLRSTLRLILRIFKTVILSEANITASARGMKGGSIGIELEEQERRAVIGEAIRQAAFQPLVWTVAATVAKSDGAAL